MKFFKRINLLVFGLAIAISFTQCSDKKKDSFTVTVKYHNADKLAGSATPAVHILLHEIPYGGDATPVILDSTTVKNASGTITLKGNGKEEGIYQVVVENGPSMLLVNDASSIEMDIDLSKKDDYYTVSGSTASKQLKDFINAYSEKSFVVNRAFNEIDSLKKINASDSLVIVATEKKNKGLEALNQYLNQFLDQSQNPAVSLFALGMSSRSFPREDFEKSLDAATKKFPTHNVLAQLKSRYEMQQAQSQAKSEEQSWVGKPAPVMSLPDVNGNPVSLASYKGKYVLVDFWASWCGPCRQENPNVVAAYQKFKGKNFDILGVSLDKAKDPWLAAIKEDNLTWTQVSDLKFWNSEAVNIFKFQGIPYNVLIDPQGKIIAEGLRGSGLERKLEEVLK